MIQLSYCTDIELVRRDIDKIQLNTIPDGSGWAKGDGSVVKDGWLNGMANARLETADLALIYPGLGREILDHLDRIDASLTAVTQILVNQLGPQSRLDWHRDGKPYRERWHLVVYTNKFCYWSDAINGSRHFSVGWWGPVPYCGILHTMSNNGEAPRVHVVMDIDREALA